MRLHDLPFIEGKALSGRQDDKVGQGPEEKERNDPLSHWNKHLFDPAHSCEVVVGEKGTQSLADC